MGKPRDERPEPDPRLDHSFGCCLGGVVAYVAAFALFHTLRQDGYSKRAALAAAAGVVLVGYPLCGAILSLLVSYVEYRVRLVAFNRRSRR